MSSILSITKTEPRAETAGRVRLLGIAALVARRLPGWRRFAPLSVGTYYVAMIPIQIVFFIGPNGMPSATLLAFWGLTWVLLGYAIFSEEVRERKGIGT